MAVFSSPFHIVTGYGDSEEDDVAGGRTVALPPTLNILISCLSMPVVSLFPLVLPSTRFPVLPPTIPQSFPVGRGLFVCLLLKVRENSLL